MKDGFFFVPPFTWGFFWVAIGPPLAGTAAADLALSEDPVFLARGLR